MSKAKVILEQLFSSFLQNGNKIFICWYLSFSSHIFQGKLFPRIFWILRTPFMKNKQHQFPHLGFYEWSLGQLEDSSLKLCKVSSKWQRFCWSSFDTYWLSISEVWKFKLWSQWVMRALFVAFAIYMNRCTLLLLGNSVLDPSTSQGDA